VRGHDCFVAFVRFCLLLALWLLYSHIKYCIPNVYAPTVCSCSGCPHLCRCALTPSLSLWDRLLCQSVVSRLIQDFSLASGARPAAQARGRVATRMSADEAIGAAKSSVELLIDCLASPDPGTRTNTHARGHALAEGFNPKLPCAQSIEPLT